MAIGRTRHTERACLLLAWCWAGVGLAWASPLLDHVDEAGAGELARLRASGDLGASRAALSGLLDRTASTVDRGSLDALGAAYFYDRFAHDLAELSRDARDRALAAERAHPELVRALVFALDRRHDDVERAWALLLRLIDERADAAASLPALAAAVAVVHDEPLAHRINENTAAAADPVAIFDHFVTNRRRLAIDPAALPVELLVFVVDTTAPPPDMEWALQRYARRLDVGSTFFEIEYDVAHFRGAPKKLTQSGAFSLPAIQEHGGVCADQAYYAMTVAKSFGIPSAYVVGRSSEVGHAWVGYVQARGRRVQWNLDEGRYDDYQDLRGFVEHPQTRSRMDDSRLALLAGLASGGADKPRNAKAAAYVVERWGASPPAGPIEPIELGRGSRAGRSGSADDRLELLLLGMRAAPARQELWDALLAMASDGELSVRQMDEWARQLDRMCGTAYPDFSASVLRGLIRSVEGVPQRSRMLDWAFGRFRGRADLAAEIRYEQSRLWQESGDFANAWAGYNFIIDQFANEGQTVLGAVNAAATMLLDQGKPGEIMPLFDRALSKVERPSSGAGGAFVSQSNYARLRSMQRYWRERLRGEG